MKEIIILVSGVAGTGKTTLSNLLVSELKLDHHIGLGWIRETVCAHVKEEDFPELFSFSFKPVEDVDIFHHFYKQAMQMKPSIEACLKRARREGTSVVIEGVNLIPEIIDDSLFDFHFFLQSKGEDGHKQMLLGKSHSKREIKEEDFQKIREIERKFLDLCDKNEKVYVIPAGDNQERLNKIWNIIKEEKNEILS
ncbi:hypothetical protein CL616_02820 [archaeon]|nr:hypothetical protein [archaeon]|tara:strand:+ start:55 stop:639 length:585 start_codon:yes stop_codon:yes gene_type:complete